MSTHPTDTIDPELPRRRRRRLVTPWTAGLAAVLIAALGFVGGVEVQKGQGSSNGSGGAPDLRAAFGGSGPPAGFPGPGGGAPGQEGSGVSGTIASKRGAVLYVTTADGATVKVRTNDNSAITRNAGASARGLYPGDTVLVQGSTAKSGVVTATSVTATAASAAG